MDAFLFRVKAAQRDLIERCGGIERVVTICGFSKSQVGRWNSPNDPDLMPIGAVVALERDCGQALVTSVMAQANTRRLTDPDIERAQEVCLIRNHSELMRKSAELAHTVAMAIEDGQVSPSEASSIDRVAAALEHAASNLRAGCAVIKARGGQASQLRVVGEGE